MIQSLLLDKNADEARMLEDRIRRLCARYLDEDLAVERPGGGSEELDDLFSRWSGLSMALLDVTDEQGLHAAALVRAHYPDAQILVIADSSMSPMTYLTPQIRPSALFLRNGSGQQEEKILRDFFLLAVSPFLKRKEDWFWAKTRDGTQKIPLSGILYFEAREKRVYIRTRSREYGVGGTIESLSEKLPDRFIRCHRSYIINRDLIEKVRLAEGTITLAGGVIVPLSRSYKAGIKEVTGGRADS